MRRYPTDSDGVPEPGAARETVVTIPTDASHGPPDGITVDSDGNIWAALAETGSIVCYSPTGAAVDIQAETTKLDERRWSVMRRLSSAVWRLVVYIGEMLDVIW